MNEENKHDILKKIFRRNLENHQAPVDFSDWKVINSRLNSKSLSKKKIFVVWSAIAASITIILMIASLYNNKESNQLSKNSAIVENSHEYPDPKDDNLTLLPDSSNRETNTITPRKKQRIRTQLAASAIIHEEQINQNTGVNNEKTDIKDTVIFDEQERAIIPQKQQEKQLTAKQTDNHYNLSNSKKGRQSLLLAASFHTNSGVGSNALLPPPSYVVDMSPEFNWSSSPGDRVEPPNKNLILEDANGEYLPPLSF